jgi:Uma2 family endonuclease
MRSRAFGDSPGPFRAEQIHSSDPYELSDGHLIECFPTGGSGSGPNQLGASVVGWDPAVNEAGVDTGYSPHPKMLRAPDVAVGNVPGEPGWVPGAPDLAIEYADVGQDEKQLQQKITDLLAAGTKFLWVVRLVGLRRVEVHEPNKPTRTVLPGHYLVAEGVLKNPVLVESLYDRSHAERATLTNLIQRQGYESLAAVLAEGRKEGREEGRLIEARSVLRRIAVLRGFTLGEEQQIRIEACQDLPTIERWLDQAVVVTTVDEALQ